MFSFSFITEMSVEYSVSGRRRVKRMTHVDELDQVVAGEVHFGLIDLVNDHRDAAVLSQGVVGCHQVAGVVQRRH